MRCPRDCNVRSTTAIFGEPEVARQKQARPTAFPAKGSTGLLPFPEDCDMWIVIRRMLISGVTKYRHCRQSRNHIIILEIVIFLLNHRPTTPLYFWQSSLYPSDVPSVIQKPIIFHDHTAPCQAPRTRRMTKSPAIYGQPRTGTNRLSSTPNQISILTRLSLSMRRHHHAHQRL